MGKISIFSRYLESSNSYPSSQNIFFCLSLYRLTFFYFGDINMFNLCLNIYFFTYHMKKMIYFIIIFIIFFYSQKHVQVMFLIVTMFRLLPESESPGWSQVCPASIASGTISLMGLAADLWFTVLGDKGISSKPCLWDQLRER